MIRRLIALLLASLAIAGCDGAPDTSQTPGRPALWAVETGRGDPAGWLFGTIHALPKQTRWTTGTIERAFVAAGVLVVEVRDLDPKAIATVFEALNRDCPCPPLTARVGAADGPALAQMLGDNDADPRAYDRFETWAAALALAAADDGARAGHGADQALMARAGGKPVVELEGARSQLAIFDRLPESAQRAMLTAVVRGHADAETDAERLTAAWLAGDVAMLERETTRGLLGNAQLHAALLKDRNEAWLAKVKPMIVRGDRPFVAVGAAHLLGPDGLIALLSAQGYRVRRLQ